jgi:hypothetical protein
MYKLCVRRPHPTAHFCRVWARLASHAGSESTHSPTSVVLGPNFSSRQSNLPDRQHQTVATSHRLLATQQILLSAKKRASSIAMRRVRPHAFDDQGQTVLQHRRCRHAAGHRPPAQRDTVGRGRGVLQKVLRRQHGIRHCRTRMPRPGTEVHGTSCSRAGGSAVGARATVNPPCGIGGRRLSWVSVEERRRVARTLGRSGASVIRRSSWACACAAGLRRRYPRRSRLCV